MTTSRRSLLLTAAAALSSTRAPAQEQLDFLTGLSEHGDLKDRLPRYLKRLAHERLAERKREVLAMRTPADVARRKAYIRKTMEEAVGGFPERTPLNSKTVGVIEKDGYRIEKVVFESRPEFYVTANLYLPARGDGPFPAVLYPLGHERGGKSHDVWQRMLATLAREGYVALAWDPVGQGERAQIYDPDLRGRKLIRSTTEHTVLGVQCLLAGDNIARYTIWDGIRALDYLLSRPEVDDSRVACTGNSGGGTHTSYISALEDRIHVAAPSCYLTGWGRLLETIGPQDAEQVLLPWIGAGLDHADFAIAFAPRPFLVLSAVRDFFSIAGARATYQEAKRVYGLFNAEEKIRMAEVDRGHGYHQPNRIRAYQWFARWFKEERRAGGEEPVEVLEFEDLACTPTGQVADSLGGETVFTLNRKRVESFSRTLPSVDAKADLEDFRKAVVERAKTRSGFRGPSGDPQVETYGIVERQGYRIEKLLYRPEAEIVVSALLLARNTRERKPGLLYLDGAGKSGQAGPGGDVEWFVRQGFAVLSVDVRGWGESDRVDERNGSDFPRYFGDYDSAMTSFLLGTSLVAQRAADALAGVDLLAGRGDVLPDRLSIVGRGKGAVPALYAAALDERIRQVALEEMLVSYRAVVERRIHRDVLESVVVGALRDYDLPDLVASLAPRNVRLIDPVDPLGVRLWPEQAREAYRSAARVFETAGAADALQVLRRGAYDDSMEAYADFG